MKKILTVLGVYLILIIFFNVIEVNAQESEEYSETDYKTFVEIVMSTGKLLRDYSDLEYEAFCEKTDGTYFYTVVVVPIYKNVQASYISNTLFNVYNDSKTDVKYNFDVTVETNNKVSFSASQQISASGGGNIDKVKAEASAKAGLEFSASTTKSKKEKQSMDIVVEAGSRAIIYLTGNLRVSNGIVAIYGFFYRQYYGGFEFVTLESQYARIEKVKL